MTSGLDAHLRVFSIFWMFLWNSVKMFGPGKKKKECVEESRLPRGGGVAAPSAPARPVFPAGPLRPGGLVLPTGAACGGRTPRGGSRREQLL